ncbi:hypothetical protein [Qipengyuania sp. NPDC077563]|uniref:hypothetical protein n=1 Tax=Qipengyuania sp. NPDC077563 TaxID=3364497 RepID=UPI00384EE7A7
MVAPPETEKPPFLADDASEFCTGFEENFIVINRFDSDPTLGYDHFGMVIPGNSWAGKG